MQPQRRQEYTIYANDLCTMIFLRAYNCACGQVLSKSNSKIERRTSNFQHRTSKFPKCESSVLNVRRLMLDVKISNSRHHSFTGDHIDLLTFTESYSRERMTAPAAKFFQKITRKLNAEHRTLNIEHRIFPSARVQR